MGAVAIESPSTTRRAGARPRRARGAGRTVSAPETLIPGPVGLTERGPDGHLADGDLAGPGLTDGGLGAAASGVVLAVRSAPPLDPPFEDEFQPPTGMELLPVDWSEADAERRQVSTPKRRLPRAPHRDGSAGGPQSPGSAITARAALQRYVGMCVEVLNGYRPTTHLRPGTDAQRFGDVADQLVRRTVRVRMSPGQAARHGRLVRVRRMLICEPLDGIAEAAVVLEQGDMCWAMAVRMERECQGDRAAGGGWLCTLVQVI